LVDIAADSLLIGFHSAESGRIAFLRIRLGGLSIFESRRALNAQRGRRRIVLSERKGRAVSCIQKTEKALKAILGSITGRHADALSTAAPGRTASKTSVGCRTATEIDRDFGMEFGGGLDGSKTALPRLFNAVSFGV
jgi:hypothetical protein